MEYNETNFSQCTCLHIYNKVWATKSIVATDGKSIHLEVSNCLDGRHIWLFQTLLKTCYLWTLIRRLQHKLNIHVQCTLVLT